MPCRTDYEPSYSHADCISKSSYLELKEKADLATRLLCELTSNLPTKYLRSAELQKWIIAHAEFDKSRRVEEAKQKKRDEINASIKKLQEELKAIK